MRLSAALVALLTASASGLTLFGSDDQSVIINDELDVPGESPLKYCEAARDDDIIVIEKVDLVPNPPEAGQDLVIEAKGTVKEPIQKGAYVELQVKYGYIRLVNMRADLCDQISNVDLECPIDEGVISITKSVELPNEIPPGKYTVHADVYTEDERRITCLDAVVNFARGNAATLEFDL